jgi:DNA invertase Pin-like site-specific DNA recombinase
MTAKAPKAPPKVFSYVRFSSDEQKLGDSERRQVEDADAWVKRKGLTVDRSLDLTDRGLSGYHGFHRTRGKLGRFLAAVKSGMVPRGSILLVENIDRLGREGPKRMLQEIIFKLWDHGITLQTFSPDEEYGPGCADDPRFVVLILLLQRAWDESKRKSDLAHKNWTQKQKMARETNAVVTGYCPAWLKVIEWRDNGKGGRVAAKFAPVPEAAKVIRTIFKLKLEGLGWGLIAKRLNAEASWFPPKRRKSNRTEKWRETYIQKIVANPAVIGAYQPYRKEGGKRHIIGDPITGYYPAVISTEDFYNLRKKMNQNNGDKAAKGGRVSKARNLFSYLTTCGYCGGPMTYIDKGRDQRGGQWFVCDAARRGAGCRRNSIRYDEVEGLILRNCRDIKPEEVLPNPSAQVAKVTELKKRLAGKEAELEGIETSIDNLIDNLANAKDADLVKRVEAKVGKIRERKAEVEAGLNADRVELEKSEQGHKSFNEWQANLKTMFAALESGDVELRLKLRAHLRTFLDKIIVYADGEETPLSKNAPKDYIPFLRDLQKRRATKEGRFIKLLYSTNTERKTCLAPKDSIAFENGMPRKTLAGGWKMMGRAAELFKEWQRSA